METITLVTTALIYAQPFLQKIGEGASRKIGEDIWNLIKRPFNKKGLDIEKLNEDEIKLHLTEIVENDSEFKNELEKYVVNAQAKIDKLSQNIANNGSVQKQVNIGSNIGNINL